ncbi:MAG: transcription termination/antitermination protein NusG [bacterium]
MININLRDYDNWYVLKTISRRESQIKNKIDKLFNNYFNMLIPLKKLLHTKNGNLVKTVYPLFPGYIFLHKEVHAFIDEIVNIKLRQSIKPFCFNDKPAKVKPEEMQYLDSIINEHGIVPLSKGIFHESDNVEILSGPLKDFNGTIIFINRKKFEAKVRVKLFNREIDTVIILKILEFILPKKREGGDLNVKQFFSGLAD